MTELRPEIQLELPLLVIFDQFVSNGGCAVWQ